MTILNVLSRTALVAVALTATAHASDINEANLSVSPSFVGGTGPFYASLQQPGSLSIFGSASGGFESQGSGSVQVQTGALQVDGHFFGSGTVQPDGLVRDTIMITAPGVPTGTAGVMNFLIQVSGGISAPGGLCYVQWGTTVNLGGGFLEVLRQGVFNGAEMASPGYNGDPIDVVPGSYNFQFGVPITVEFRLYAACSSSYGGTGAAQAALSSPIRATWGGITSVIVDNLPIFEYEIPSETGTDWRVAIPFVGCVGDFNNDGIVDGADLGSLLGAWGSSGVPQDLNGDGEVDGADLGTLLGAWGDC